MSEDSLSVTDARGDVIDRKIDPNAFESPQVLVHIALVAERVDLGESQKLPRTSLPRSASAATTSSLRGKKRFRIPTGNFSHRKPAKAANERAQ